jgi:hypothetical protein
MTILAFTCDGDRTAAAEGDFSGSSVGDGELKKAP